MFQSFESHASADQGPPRLLALRERLAAMGLQGFIVPRADVHQGEYVAARDERLQWLTGFTGSAGFCIVLPEVAGVFIDGRYRTQVKSQVDLAAFTPVPWPEVKPGDWVKEKLASGRVGFDPWLHTADEVERLQKALEGTGIAAEPLRENPVDAIWADQPDAPLGKAFVHPLELAGESHAEKRGRLAEGLRKAGQKAAVGYGSTGATSAIQHLQNIAVELQMVSVRNNVRIGGSDFFKVHPGFGGSGNLADIEAGIAPAAAGLLDDLVWWAKATKGARTELATVA